MTMSLVIVDTIQLSLNIFRTQFRNDIFTLIEICPPSRGPGVHLTTTTTNLRPESLVTGNVDESEDLVLDFGDEMSFVVLDGGASLGELFVDESKEEEGLAGVTRAHEEDRAPLAGRTAEKEEEEDGEDDDDDAEDDAQRRQVSLDHLVHKVLHNRDSGRSSRSLHCLATLF